MAEPLLVLKGLTRRFGGLVALNSLDMEVSSGHIHALIGPNGAGKTTAINAVSGIQQPSAGTIHFRGQPIHDLASHRIARLGLRRTFQNLRLFRSLSVVENVMVGLQSSDRSNLLHAILMLSKAEQERQRLKAAAEETLQFVGLWEKRNWLSTSLSYGQQRLLEVARVLASRPVMLLLDEPAAGLNDTETHALMHKLTGIRDMGISILLIEHNMSLVMEVADRITVLDFGSKIAEGGTDEVRNNPSVIEAYLGREDDNVTPE